MVECDSCWKFEVGAEVTSQLWFNDLFMYVIIHVYIQPCMYMNKSLNHNCLA